MTSFGIDAIAVTLRGVAAPGDTPDDVYNCLVDAVAQVAEDSEFVEFMEKSFLGLEYKDPEETVKFLEERRDIIKPIMEEQISN
jgi:tripartite-type tricarboxylate transporter receptor subunit TctC